MIYFDNSATTNYKPPNVKLSIIKNLSKYNTANPGRSGHKLSVKLGNKIFSVRQTLANFFNTSPFNVIFTSGCTESLNLAIFGTIKPNGHIITTINEHNSVLRAITKIQKDYNIEITYIKPKNLIVTPEEISSCIKNNTYMIIVNHTSNVTGATCNIEEIGKIAKNNNLIYLVDSAQSGGHIKIDVQKCNINFLAVAGHKGLHGISGTGVLIVNNIPNDFIPFKYGGTGTDSKNLFQPISIPESFEAGTLNYLGIFALGEGVKFVDKNFDKINKKITSLTKYLVDNLSKNNNIDLYFDESSFYSGVISFNVKNHSSDEVSNFLNTNYNIYIRSGLHCAPLVHEFLGTLDSGTCRISLDFKNSKHQIDVFLNAISDFIEQKDGYKS